jgi:hypothetical protein
VSPALKYAVLGWLIIIETAFAICGLIAGQHWETAAYGAAALFIVGVLIWEVGRDA